MLNIRIKIQQEKFGTTIKKNYKEFKWLFNKIILIINKVKIFYYLFICLKN